MRLYKSYSFVDKDPVIDHMRTMIDTNGLEHSEIADRSGVSANTMHQWFHGKTRRPQYATVAAVMGAMGYQLMPIRPRGKNGRR